MIGSQPNTSQFIVGIALVSAAVLIVLFTDYPAAAAIGVPGLGLIATSRLVLVTALRRQQIARPVRCDDRSGER